MAQLHPNHFLLLLLFYPFLFLLHGGVADAQGSMEPVPTYISHHKWEPSFAITIGVVIFALVFMGIISIYIRKCAASHSIPRNSNRTNQATTEWSCSCSQQQGITKEILNTFPILFYPAIKDLKMGKESLECAVCLTDFKDCDTLRLLPKCNHVFHPQCIDSWLCSHVTCPVCRANLNQDSCEVAITVPTHLSTPQRVEESLGIRPESNGGEENEAAQNPVTAAENEGQGKTEDGGLASKSVLSRSNSTGHSLEERGGSAERFTLTLPEDVRRYILVNHDGRVHRSASYSNSNGSNVVSGVCWSDSEGGSVEKKGNGGEAKGGCFGGAMVEN